MRVGSAVVGLHPAGARVDGHHRGPHLRHLAVEILRHRVLGGLLRLRVDGRGDLEALGVQRLLVDVEQVEQFLGDLTLDQAVGPVI